MGIDKLPDVTLLVQMLYDETIKVEAFQGHLSDPEFTDKALIMRRNEELIWHTRLGT